MGEETRMKTLMLLAMMSNQMSENTENRRKKMKNIAISVTFIVAANALIYSPIILSNINKED